MCLLLLQRKKTLLVEYRQLRKANAFVDRRFGEEDESLTAEEKAIARFQKQRMKEFEGAPHQHCLIAPQWQYHPNATTAGNKPVASASQFLLKTVAQIVLTVYVTSYMSSNVETINAQGFLLYCCVSAKTIDVMHVQVTNLP